MQVHWPLWRRMLFRFFFIYIALTITPWTWFDRMPFIGNLTKPYYDAMDWLVRKSNDLVFHVRPVLVPTAGSGDTSFGWAALCFVLGVSFIGMIIWSIVQRRKKEYVRLNYWLCLFTRYYVALVLFSYGIIKVFGLQMSFPSYSQLATPLGDYLPMRFSWLFIGYSTPYQFFSGLMEVLAGLLLLYRRTSTLGVLMATGVFLHVAVLNLSYDIPVKIYSIQMVVYCLFLMAHEMDRLLCFFVYNRPANACNVYQRTFPKRWMRVARVTAKIVFIAVAVGAVVYESLDWKKQMKQATASMTFDPGMYDVTDYTLNNDTMLPLWTDSARWQNLIFDNARSGSIATRDTSFRLWYNRAYFSYKVDTAKRTFKMLKSMRDSNAIASLQYRFEDPKTILFWGKMKNDSVSFVLRKSARHFPLADKEFNWVTEYIR